MSPTSDTPPSQGQFNTGAAKITEEQIANAENPSLLEVNTVAERAYAEKLAITTMNAMKQFSTGGQLQKALKTVKNRDFKTPETPETLSERALIELTVMHRLFQNYLETIPTTNKKKSSAKISEASWDFKEEAIETNLRGIIEDTINSSEEDLRKAWRFSVWRHAATPKTNQYDHTKPMHKRIEKAALKYARENWENGTLKIEHQIKLDF